MSIARFISIVSSENMLYRMVQVVRAYWEWYRYGSVCIHAIENSITGASASFTVQKDHMYRVHIRWFSETMQPVDWYAVSDNEQLFYTYWNVLCPMVTSVDIIAQYTQRTARGFQETCYITETGVYYVTTDGDALIHVYRL